MMIPVQTTPPPTIEPERFDNLCHGLAFTNSPIGSNVPSTSEHQSGRVGQATSAEGLLPSSGMTLLDMERWLGDKNWIPVFIIQASGEPSSTNVIPPWIVSVTGVGQADLHATLRDLDEAKDEADEEGMSPPSALALANADRLIREMYTILPRRYLVELMPEGSIAVSVPGGFRRSVMLLCESNGGALCSVNMNGKHRRARYSHADQLPDGFLREALAELEQG